MSSVLLLLSLSMFTVAQAFTSHKHGLNRLSKWILKSSTRQTSHGRLSMKSRRSGSCSINIQSARLFRRFGGGRYKQKKM